ncbi:hypothetical protein [Amycolatopsis cihanbeyliensis]|uniref:Uncharacterized protein n=1 Tax=Amycolatopsis cihanbeyliensis TaxID=1128664 RepID=A0A542DNI5_AMYCI|nr:hypothetical protein [Amycolatopsis cihanbeyliensis]TQJ04650.1 hypothetical protein FB471_4453 [Amycolatopsis cihanbeyliensis]
MLSVRERVEQLVGGDEGTWREAVETAASAMTHWSNVVGTRPGQETELTGRVLLHYVVSLAEGTPPREVTEREILTWLAAYRTVPPPPRSPAPSLDEDWSWDAERDRAQAQLERCRREWTAMTATLADVLRRAGHTLPDPQSYEPVPDPAMRLWWSLNHDPGPSMIEPEDTGDPALPYALDTAIRAMDAAVVGWPLLGLIEEFREDDPEVQQRLAVADPVARQVLEVRTSRWVAAP